MYNDLNVPTKLYLFHEVALVFLFGRIIIYIKIGNRPENSLSITHFWLKANIDRSELSLSISFQIFCGAEITSARI